ncbi:hypothetical protein TWF281_001109 [Arthrobotrys megalospora]
MVRHSKLLNTPNWSPEGMTPSTNPRRRFASIDEVIAKAMADGTASPPPAQAPASAASKVKGLIATWSQRAEPADAVTKKSSLTGLKHLGPKHVQNRIQQFSKPTDATSEVVKIGGGFVKRRIAALEDVRAACQYALDRQQGVRPTMATPTGPAPDPVISEDTPVTSEFTMQPEDVSVVSASPMQPDDQAASPDDQAASPDSLETESQILMREIEGMDILSSASRHFHDWHSDLPTPDTHPMVRAPTDFQRDTGLSVGVSAIPPLSTGTATVFGTRRYRRGTLTQEQSEIQAATRVTRRLVSDTHWLKANKKPSPAIPAGARAPVVPARLLQGAQSLRKATSQLPIAKYYTNNYDPEDNDDFLPRLQRMVVTQNITLPSRPAPADNPEGFTEYKVAGRFGIFNTRPRLVARPKVGENLAPTFPRVPKLRRRTPPQVTLDLFNKIWPNGHRKPSH